MSDERRKIIHIVPDHAIPQRRVDSWDSYPTFVRKIGPSIVISLVLWYGIYHVVRWVLR